MHAYSYKITLADTLLAAIFTAFEISMKLIINFQGCLFTFTYIDYVF